MALVAARHSDRNSGRSPRNSKFSGMQNSLDTGASDRGGQGDTRGGGRSEPEFDSSGRPSSMNRGGTRGTGGGTTSDRNSGRSPRNSKFSGMQNSLDTGGSDRSSQSDSKKSTSGSKKSSNEPAGPAKL